MERGDYAVLLFFAEAEIQRQADGAGVVGFGGGEVALLKAEALAVIGLGVHRDVVHVCADAVGAQVVKDLAAGLAASRLHIFRLYLDGVEMQGGLVGGIAVGQDKGQIGKQFVVAGGKRVAAGDKFV